MKRRYEACLFDLYGTLVYFDRDEYMAKAAAAAAACGLAQNVFIGVWNSLVKASNLGQFQTTAERVRRLLELTGKECGEHTVQEVCSIEHTFLREKVRLFDDVVETLNSLRQAKVKLGLVTNASPSVREVLRSRNINALMDAIVVSSDVRIRKPDVEVYQICLRRLGVAQSAALFVGDGADQELEGAKHAGLQTVMILRQSFRPEPVEASGADYIDYKIQALSRVPEIMGVTGGT